MLLLIAIGGRPLGAPFLAQLINFAITRDLARRFDDRTRWQKFIGQSFTVYDVPFAWRPT